jgi:hypothetical protein
LEKTVASTQLRLPMTLKLTEKRLFIMVKDYSKDLFRARIILNFNYFFLKQVACQALIANRNRSK